MFIKQRMQVSTLLKSTLPYFDWKNHLYIFRRKSSQRSTWKHELLHMTANQVTTSGRPVQYNLLACVSWQHSDSLKEDPTGNVLRGEKSHLEHFLESPYASTNPYHPPKYAKYFGKSDLSSALSWRSMKDSEIHALVILMFDLTERWFRPQWSLCAYFSS